MFDFIRKNFEKVILASLLLIFVLSLVWLLTIFRDVSEDKLVIVKRAPETTMDFMIKENVNKYGLATEITKGEQLIEVNGELVERNSLISSIPMAVCTNITGDPKVITDPVTGQKTVTETLCNKLIPRHFFKEGYNCPECGLAMHEKDEIDVWDDDGDGITNDAEEKYGLNPRDKRDAYLDLDGDGFSNVVEYLGKAGEIELGRSTDMSDKKDHPPLAYRLYFDSIERHPINFIVNKVDTYGDNETAWNVLVKYGKKDKLLRIGQKIAVEGQIYTLSRIIKQKEKVEHSQIQGHFIEVDNSVAQFSSEKFPEIIAKVKEIIYEPTKYYVLYDKYQSRKIICSIGETIAIGDISAGIERYLVKNYNEAENIVKLLREKNEKEFTVSSLDFSAQVSGTPIVKGNQNGDEDN